MLKNDKRVWKWYKLNKNPHKTIEIEKLKNGTIWKLIDINN